MDAKALAKLIGRTGTAALTIKQAKGSALFHVRVRVTNARPAFGRMTYEVEPETTPFYGLDLPKRFPSGQPVNRVWINAKAVMLDKEAR